MPSFALSNHIKILTLVFCAANLGLLPGAGCGNDKTPVYGTVPPVDTDVPPIDGDVRPDAGNPTDLSCLEMIPLRLWIADPSAVAMLYRIETCVTREAVVLDPAPGESVFDYYALTENGSTLSSEAVPDVDRSERQRAYVMLLLDFSSSTRLVETELLASARAFVEQVIGASDRVWVGVQVFDGRPAPVIVVLPTRDLPTLRTALAGLAGYSDPLADSGSTNLHGAMVSAVSSLQTWQSQIMARNDDGVVTSGYVVAFTDGRDTSERVTAADAASAVLAARTALVVDSAPTVQTYGVAFSVGADYTAAARAAFQQVLGDPSYLLEGASTDLLLTRFEELAARIAAQAQATHLLKYCSAARSGSREVVLGIAPVAGRMGSNSIRVAFSADSFAAGCSTFIETICDGRACGGFNCGGCNDATESCLPSGACINSCVPANSCTGATITNDLGYAQTCSHATLGANVRQCAGVCSDTTSDDANCGACGNMCETLGGAGERCVAGACVCSGGGEVCADRCQVSSYFTNNNAHCGSCGNNCTGGAMCSGTTCACTGGQTFCDGACRDAAYFETTAANCGTCDTTCTSTQSCTRGICACPGVVGDLCMGVCRDLASDRMNCGTCGTACASGRSCTEGACNCAAGYTGSTCATPVCTTPCANGGSCTAPNVCDCAATDYMGSTCQTPIPICGPTTCPALPGYTPTCNGHNHCEYARTSPTATWHADDVWIYIPAGSFPMGEPTTEAGSSASARPIHTVTFAQGFFIGKYEVTTRIYEACEGARSCTRPSVADWDGDGWGLNRTSNNRATHPQNGVNWAQAGEVCAWLGGRRPSEAEWEYAAKGPSTHRKYPWGDRPEPTCANGTAVMNEAATIAGYGCGTGGTWPVGQKAVGLSAVGALDMAGNLWEWVEDCWHDNYTGAPSNGLAWTANCSNPNRVKRGGSFYYSAAALRGARRDIAAPAYRSVDNGARCLRPFP